MIEWQLCAAEVSVILKNVIQLFLIHRNCRYPVTVPKYFDFQMLRKTRYVLPHV
jgi:hypothetical protein